MGDDHLALREKEDRVLDILVEILDEDLKEISKDHCEELLTLSDGILQVTSKVVDAGTLGLATPVYKGIKAIIGLFQGKDIVSKEKFRDVISYDLLSCLVSRAKNHEARISVLEEEKCHSTAIVINEFQTPDMDVDINDAKELFLKRDFALAEYLLNRTRERKWSSLDGYRRFRVCALLGSIFELRGQLKQAAAFFIEAHNHYPNFEKAFLLAISGYGLLNEKAMAAELFEKAEKQFPVSTDLQAIRVRAVPSSEEELTSLISKIPPFALETFLVQNEIAHKYEFFKSKENAIKHARKAISILDSDYRPWCTIATMMLGTEYRKVNPESPISAAKPLDKENLLETVGNFTTSLQCISDKALDTVKAQILVNRGLTQRLLGDNQAALNDYSEAYELAPTSPPIAIDYALFLLNLGSRDLAAEVISKFKKSNPSESANFANFLLLGTSSKNVDRTQSLEDGIQYLQQQFNKKHRIAVLKNCVVFLLQENRLEDAESLVRETGDVSNDMKAVLQAQIALTREDEDRSRELARGIYDNLTEESTIEVVLDAAGLFMSLKDYDRALPLWKKLTFFASYDSNVDALLFCAKQLEDDLTIKNACEELERNKLGNRKTLYYHVMAIEKFYPSKAICLLTDFLKENQNDHEVAITLIQISIRENNIESVNIAVSHISELSSLTCTQGCIYTDALVVLDRLPEALDASYYFLKMHWTNAEAHMKYLAVCMRDGARPNREFAEPGTAVRYKELRQNIPESWILIEDALDTVTRDDEVRSTSPIAESVSGKKVGDLFTLAPAPGRDREGEILEILDKHIFMFRDVSHKYQTRFPDTTGIYVYNVADPDGTVTSTSNFDFIFRILEESRAKDEPFLEKYRSSVMPTRILSKFWGLNIVEAQIRTASDESLSIYAWKDSDKQLQLALSRIEKAQKMVVDASALTTLVLLNMVDVLDRIDGRIIVSPSTLRTLRTMVSTTTIPRTEGYLEGSCDKPVFHPVSEEQLESNRYQWQVLVDKIAENHDVPSDVTSILEMDISSRRNLEKTLGLETLESIHLAREKGAVLWVDDFYVGQLGQELLGINFLWTQGYLETLVDKGKVDAVEFDRASALLFSMGYENTRVSIDVFRALGDITGWNIDVFPTSRFLVWINKTNIPSRNAAMVGAMFSVCAYNNIVIPEQRQDVLLKVLQAISKRKDKHAVLFLFRNHLIQFFGKINTLLMDDALSIVDPFIQSITSGVKL